MDAVFVNRDRNRWMVFVTLGGAALIWLLYATRPWGLGVSHDSVFYLSAAGNFSRGEGLRWVAGGGELKTLTHFPPLYSVLLSLIGRVTGDLESGARLLAAVHYAGNIVLISVWIYLITASAFYSTMGAGLALISPLLLELHLETMTEPQFLFLTLISLILLSIYLQSGEIRSLVGSAIFASLAFLTRYVGVSLVLTSLWFILFRHRGSKEDRRKHAALFGVISTAPNLLWNIRNYLLTGSLTNRVLGFHLPSREQLTQAVASISTWLVPDVSSGKTQLLLAFGIMAAGLAILIYIRRNSTHEGSSVEHRIHPLFTISVVFIIMYGSLLFTSITFFDASTPLSNRILSPIYLFLLILGVIAFYFLIRRHRLLTLPVVIGVSLLAITYVSRSVELVGNSRDLGRGFNSAAWRESATMAEVREFGPGTIIYSNEAFPIWYLSGLPAYWIPEKVDPVKAQPRAGYQAEIELMRRRLESENSALVLFHPDSLREGMPAYEEITSGLVLIDKAEDGEIHRRMTVR